MIVTELYKGQGLGNQLACYIATRVIALDKGYTFGIKSPEKFKGGDFLDLDFGKTVIGGTGPEGGPPVTLPEGIQHYYSERRILHPENGADITLYDANLVNIQDNTKIDGLMQDEQYIAHRKKEIKEWLHVKQEYECYDYSDENTCVINFRGGEYARHPEFFLNKNYWENAIRHMLKINKNFRFIVITDDVFTAKKFFPSYGVFHFSIAKDYTIIKNAYYLILSNSSFAWFPAWTSDRLKFCIAPKYWARHNVSDGYWSLGYNITSGWYYLDREGNLSDYDTCINELKDYQKQHPNIFTNTYTKKSEHPETLGLKNLIKRKTPLWVKNIIKSIINEVKNIINYIRQPFDLLVEHERKKNWLSKLEIAEYRKKIKVYDVFLFFNELELLEIRLQILDPYVDYFVLIESTETFTGISKELFYEKNKQIFAQWQHKIIHYVIQDTPADAEDLKKRLRNQNLTLLDRETIYYTLTTDNVPDKSEIQWLKEFYQKEVIKRALVGLSDSDFCFISDLDEIWNPEILIDYSKDDVFKFKQIPYIYYLNNRSNEDWAGWSGTIATKYKNIKDVCLNHLRKVGKTKYTVVQNGGWHFSFQGGPDQIRKKLESYGHQELNTREVKSTIEDKIRNNRDIRGRFIRFWTDESMLPRYLKENKGKYKKLFK